jgi:hypothetical protein
MPAADLRLNSPCLLFQHDPTEIFRGILYTIGSDGSKHPSAIEIQILKCVLSSRPTSQIRWQKVQQYHTIILRNLLEQFNVQDL